MHIHDYLYRLWFNCIKCRSQQSVFPTWRTSLHALWLTMLTKGSKFIGEHFHATTTIHWHRCRTRKLSYSGRCSANMGTSTFNIKFIILTLIRWRLLMHNRVRWTLTTKPNLIFSLRDKYLSVSKDNNKRRESDKWHYAICYIIAAAIMTFAKAN